MDKLKRLIQMTQHPERYTNKQWNEVFNGGTLADEQIEAEWQQFEQRHLSPKRLSSPHSSLLKVAASLIGILMLSGITLAAIHLIRTSHQPKAFNHQPTNITHSSSPYTHRNDSSLIAPHFSLHKVVFEETELQQIADSIAAFYKVSPAFRNESIRHLRLYYEWNQQARLDEIINELNHFDHVNICLKGDSIIFE